MILRPGTYLQNRYEIIEQIGAGGMSEVYKAKDHTLNRFVAIKVLKEEFCSDGTFVRKFKMEAQAAAGLSHPNIVNIYDVVDEENVHYIVMELIEGITLKNYIEKKGHLDINEATGIAIQVASGIGAAHARHIIHRDIKPQNIILSNDGKVKVADFGIARAASSQTINSTVIGSVHYISPEQAKNLVTDERSDIYSLGITMYEMVTGRLPFEGDNTVSVALAHLEETMTPPSVYNPDVPVSTEEIILKCTEKNPADRYQKIQDVITDLKKSLISPDESPVFAGAPAVSGLDGDTIVMDKKDLNAIRSVAGKERKPGRLQGTKTDEKEEKSPRVGSIITGVGITVAILAAAAILFMLLKVSGMIGERATSSDSSSTAQESSSITDKETYMPYVIGSSQDEAEGKLKDAGLQMVVSGGNYSDQFDKGLVMSQDPEAGKIVSKYSKVNVTVSLGSNKIDLSKLGIATMTGNDAKTALEAQGLTVNMTEEYSDTVETGKVISFTPDKAAKNAVVTLLISKGKETEKKKVPNITGVTEEIAIGKLTDAGFVPGKAKISPSNTVPAGTVMAQDIAADSEADAGSTVGYTLSSGPAQSTQESQTVESIGQDSGGYKYIASIDNTYKLSDLIGPGSNTTSFKVMIRLKQTVNGQAVYKVLMEPRTVTGDTILPVRFKSIEGVYGIDTGVVEIVKEDDNSVLKSYDVQFFKVQ